MKERHGRPLKSYLDSLRSPTRHDYYKLVRACLESLINGSVDVLVAFSYLTKFPDDFPKGVKERQYGNINVHRVKAKKLLEWLKSHGYTTITVEDIRQQKIAFTKAERNFGNFDQIWLDECQQMVDNVKHQQQGREDDDTSV